MKSVIAGVGVISLVAFAAACVSGVDDPIDGAPLDEPYFRCRVQPVLAKSCAFLACHGEPKRPLKVFARNRLRLGAGEATRNQRLTTAERQLNYEAALAFVDRDVRDDSLLLRKPLDQSAGGDFHRAVNMYEAGDVFASTDDAGYRALRAWVDGAKDKPTCVEPGSDL